jgi:hypothetical protein
LLDTADLRDRLGGEIDGDLFERCCGAFVPNEFKE